LKQRKAQREIEMTHLTVNLSEFGGKVQAEQGDFLAPDGWQNGQWSRVGVNASHQGSRLNEGDEAFPGWEGSEFRVETSQTVIPTLPVNVTVTGRKVHFTRHSGPRVRVQIEWVKDGEENETSRGWLTLRADRPESNYHLW
jgi:hypothetical protein